MNQWFTKTFFFDNAVATYGTLEDYDTFRQKVQTYYNDELQKAPGPIAVADAIIIVINSKNPKFSYPVGKGTSMILALQRFAYNTFESVVLKAVNKTI